MTSTNLHQYQWEAINHQLLHPRSMLWMGMGLGKTIVTLTSLVERIDVLQVHGTLILAPKRVCQTVWAQEAAHWDHTRHLRFRMVEGTPWQREAALTHTGTDIWLINYENIQWLAQTLETHYLARGLYLPFNNIVFDEVTKMKDSTGKRHRALRRILPYIPYRTGLTGTPASNGYTDLFGQYHVIDDGERLGHNVTAFRKTYCTQGGFGGYKFSIRENMQPYIEQRIADITINMNTRDYLDLPDIQINDVEIDLPPQARAKYDELEAELFVQLDSGVEIEVFNEAALCNKCLQAANGAMYITPGDPAWAPLHDAKLEAMDDIIEEAAGQPLLVGYEFTHDRDRLLARYPHAEAITGKLTGAQLERLLARWTNGEVQMLIGHPGSMGHGLNLQYGGHMGVWFGLNWSLDLYLQLVARLDRQGQTHPVLIQRILARRTWDWVQRDRLIEKDGTQTGLREAINEYRKNTAA